MSDRLQRRIARLLTGAAVLLAVLVYCFCVYIPPAQVPDLRPAEAARALPGAALDLNHATAEELEDLPGIGPALAEAILVRRTELGAFRTREDVLSVPGVGEATYEKISPYVTY